MKKLFLLTAFVAFTALATMAQNDTIFHMADITEYGVEVCINKYDRAIIYGDENCNDFSWNVEGGGDYYDNPLILEFDDEGDAYSVNWFGCGILYDHFFYASTTAVPNSATIELWKHQNESLTLAPIGADSVEMFDFRWSTDETTSTIEVAVAGTYTCSISDHCGTATRTFIVHDNVEVELATCDLETNLNMVTWPTTPAQAEYISQVEVKRDGLTVGTAPYTDGYFLDNIGSDAASRTYTVTALATDGTPCPITSHPKETIHMAYLTGINSTIEVNWNAPTGYDLLGYNICEWNATDGTLTTIDYVGASVSSYTCQQSQFDQGYIVIQGVEASKDSETRLLSNRSLDLVGIEENGPSTGSGALAIYPNPTNGQLKIEAEGIKHVSISNTLGQVIYEGKTEGDVFEYDFGHHGEGVYLIRIETARGVAVKKVTVTR